MKALRRIIGAAFAVSLMVLAGFAFYAFRIEPDSLRVVRHDLRLQRWPGSMDGFRIAVISDLHAGAPYIDLAKIERVVAMTNETKPDLVLLTGDIFGNLVLGGTPIPPARTRDVLENLRSRLGTYFVFGNHEPDHEFYRDLLSRSSVHLMENEVRRFDDDGEPFWLIGIGDMNTEPLDIPATLALVTDSAPELAFTHGPDIFPEIPPSVNLLMAGHTHGGQIILPFVGRRKIPSRFRQRYAAGHVAEQTDLFVSTGIGTSRLPMRFRVPPEISLLILHSPSSPAAPP